MTAKYSLQKKWWKGAEYVTPKCVISACGLILIWKQSSLSRVRSKHTDKQTNKLLPLPKLPKNFRFFRLMVWSRKKAITRNNFYLKILSLYLSRHWIIKCLFVLLSCNLPSTPLKPLAQGLSPCSGWPIVLKCLTTFGSPIFVGFS